MRHAKIKVTESPDHGYRAARGGQRVTIPHASDEPESEPALEPESESAPKPKKPAKSHK